MQRKCYTAGASQMAPVKNLQEEIANQASILAWKILWTEEPGGLVHGVTKN